jgi:hypothetical protein
MTAPRTTATSVAARLQRVSSADEARAIVEELAADRRRRWSRSQILFYLPAEFHSSIEEYFNGESVEIPTRPKLRLVPPDEISLAAAVDEVKQTCSVQAEEVAARERRPDPDTLEALLASCPEEPVGVIDNVRLALLEEARAVERSSPRSYRLTRGRCTGPSGDGFTYSFNWSSEPDLHAPGELWVNGRAIQARVVGQGQNEKQFDLWIPEYVDAMVDQAKFKIDPTFLLRTCYEILSAKRDLYESGSTPARELFESPASADIDAGRVELDSRSLLSHRQRKALATSALSRRSYVWGPPGTGKTTTLGHLIRHLVASGKRVLVVSPYNVAVDEALLSAGKYGNWGEFDAVRVGRISKEVREKGIDLESLLEAKARTSGLLDTVRRFHAAVVRQTNASFETPATVRQCMEDIGSLVIHLHERGNRTLAENVSAGVRAIRNQFRAPEAEIVRNAKVVGTTVTLSYLSPLIHNRAFDQIIVDEASVMRVPDALLVALSAVGKLSFFGDPHQLPSIIKGKSPRTLEWLKRNPFELAGISRPEHAKGACVLLNQQHRMAPPIRHLISSKFYGGALEDGNCPKEGRLIVVDTSETPARATTKWVKMGPSKENLVHRHVVSEILHGLRKANPDKDILVLSPYVGQRREYEAEANTNRIRNANFRTVHTSQGSEADIVVLDFVLAPGRGKSRFMNERVTPEFRNLLNVGMSRAREKLILVVHCKYMRHAYPGGLVEGVLDHCGEHGDIVVVPLSLRMGEVVGRVL